MVGYSPQARQALSWAETATPGAPSQGKCLQVQCSHLQANPCPARGLVLVSLRHLKSQDRGFQAHDKLEDRKREVWPPWGAGWLEERATSGSCVCVSPSSCHPGLCSRHVWPKNRDPSLLSAEPELCGLPAPRRQCRGGPTHRGRPEAGARLLGDGGPPASSPGLQPPLAPLPLPFSLHPGHTDHPQRLQPPQVRRRPPLSSNILFRQVPPKLTTGNQGEKQLPAFLTHCTSGEVFQGLSQLTNAEENRNGQITVLQIPDAHPPLCVVFFKQY